MKNFKKELWLNTKKRYELVHISSEVEKAVSESGIKEKQVNKCIKQKIKISEI